MNIYHSMCLQAITQWMEGKIEAKYAAYICGNVDSRNIELAEMLLNTNWY